MKISIKTLAAILVISFSVSLFADNTGCGLGTMLLKGKTGKGWELLAVFLNSIYGIQTFAITSGTSEYQEGAQIAQSEVQSYVDENMDMLASDISKGRGEYVYTLAEMMNADNKAAFAQKLKRNYSAIFTHENISSKEVLENITTVKNS